MADVGVPHDLGDDGAEGEDAVLGITIAVKVKVDAERDGERGALLGGREREELGDLEGRLTARARVVAEDGVRRDRDHLSDRRLQQRVVGHFGRQRMRIGGVVLGAVIRHTDTHTHTRREGERENSISDSSDRVWVSVGA